MFWRYNISVILVTAIFSFGTVQSFFYGKKTLPQWGHTILFATSDDITSIKNSVVSPKDSFSRSELNENILKLEKLNPTANPAESPLLNGVWEIVESGGITSPGMIGYQALKKFFRGPLELQDVVVTISSVQPRIVASTSVKIGNAPIDVLISSDLEVESPLRFKESYTSAQIGTFQLPLTSAAKYSRSLIISYLDDDLLIVRDSLGSPDVLKRQEKSFLASSAEGSPSTTDENGAPGS